mmetsp:Transcript_36638/g.57200  ORF Transcript_36638/g.57200 Transcript_36638/m.57200 type:complete len:255 (-) Transcript_36638:1491-2255(-)
MFDKICFFAEYTATTAFLINMMAHEKEQQEDCKPLSVPLRLSCHWPPLPLILSTPSSILLHPNQCPIPIPRRMFSSFSAFARNRYAGSLTSSSSFAIAATCPSLLVLCALECPPAAADGGAGAPAAGDAWRETGSLFRPRLAVIAGEPPPPPLGTAISELLQPRRRPAPDLLPLSVGLSAIMSSRRRIISAALGRSLNLCCQPSSTSAQKSDGHFLCMGGRCRASVTRSRNSATSMPSKGLRSVAICHRMMEKP